MAAHNLRQLAKAMRSSKEPANQAAAATSLYSVHLSGIMAIRIS
jgi:hypothetical protein